MHKSKTRNSFNTSYQQGGAQPHPRKQGSSWVTFSWEDKYHHSKCPPLPFFLLLPSFYCWAWCHVLWNIHSSVWSPVLAVFPPILLCTPSLLAGRTTWEVENFLILCKPCSAETKMLVCYHHYFNQKSKIQHHTSLHEEN